MPSSEPTFAPSMMLVIAAREVGGVGELFSFDIPGQTIVGASTVSFWTRLVGYRRESLSIWRRHCIWNTSILFISDVGNINVSDPMALQLFFESSFTMTRKIQVVSRETVPCIRQMQSTYENRYMRL